MHLLKRVPGPLYAIIILFLLHSGGCAKDPILKDPSAKLDFSTDTVIFDTVFTAFGSGNPLSANQRLKVYNPHDKAILTSIRLAGGANSPYRINIDGHATTHVTDYEIRKKDSLYIFVEVTIPQGGVNPFIVTDSIIFETNGNVQDVDLVAWGRDANYLQDSVLGCNVTWNSGKPFVIYNSILVPDGCTLTINPGVEVYSHSNSRIYVEGTLIVNGSHTSPVIFQGDRLEFDYREVPGQWVGIRLLPRSRGNVIQFAEIKNAIVGVEVDSLSPVNPNDVKLSISHTLIKNMASTGIAGFTAVIKAWNCAVCNCAQFSFLGKFGGNYDIKHCTFNSSGSRRNASVGFSNEPFLDPATQQPILKPTLALNLENNVIWGAEKTELIIVNDPAGGAILNASVNYNLFKTEADTLYPITNIFNTDPRFLDAGKCDLALDSLSPAIDKGDLIGIPLDIRGKFRDSRPDIGAYERQP
jgi:hypothetical protein